MRPNESIRAACNAGRFYPADPKELKTQLSSCIVAPSILEVPGTSEVLGLIAPHAGHVYSGKIAGKAYACLPGDFYRRVIVIGPSHYARFPGIGYYKGDGLSTPLGVAPIDNAFLRCLREQINLTPLGVLEEVREHSIEVQIPFLQMRLKDFNIVPLLMCEQSSARVAELSKATSLLLGSAPFSQKTLIVASSDLYHGYSSQEQEKQDRLFEELVMAMKTDDLLEKGNQGQCMACGIGPVATVMSVSQILGKGQSKIIARGNSAKGNYSSGDYIVGYLSALLF